MILQIFSSMHSKIIFCTAMKIYGLTQAMLALWYRAISEGLDSHSPRTELGRAFVDGLIIAILQHEVLLTMACMYVGHKDQDDRQRQMNILSKDLDEVRMLVARSNMPHVLNVGIHMHESCLIPCPES